MGENRRKVQIVGTSFVHGAGRVLAGMRGGAEFVLKREPTNQFDPNAVAVHTKLGFRVGYCPRGFAKDIAPILDAGIEVSATKVNLINSAIMDVRWTTPDEEAA